MDLDLVSRITTHVVRHHSPSRPMPLVTERWRLTLPEAYAVQERLVTELCRRDVVVGHKIALSSEAARRASQADEPAAGVLLGSRLLVGDSDLNLGDTIGLLAEPEVVLVATEDWTPGAGAEEIVAKAEVRAGIELPEPRYVAMRESARGEVATPADLVADNAAAGWMLVAATGRPATAVDLTRVRIALFEDDALVAADQGADVLTTTTWLTGHLARSGRHVRAGELVTTGTWVAPPPVRAATYQVHVAEVGSVTLRAFAS